MEVLLVAVVVVLTGLCAFFAWNSAQSAERAAHSEHRLAIMRGQVAGLEASIVGLDSKHQKLAGRVYADEYWRGKRDEQPDLQPLNPIAQAAGLECENWKIAQQLGPQSAEAACQCSYCEGRRLDRSQRRAKLRAGVKT